MSILIGILLALLTCGTARLVGLDRDRAFYPAALTAIATYDVLFAVIAGSPSAIVIESGFAAMVVVACLIGFRVSAWVVVAGFAVHGLADYVHDSFSPDAGIPAWWPGFCGAFDGVVAVVLALQLIREWPAHRARMASPPRAS
jgi:hypothetical protein